MKFKKPLFLLVSLAFGLVLSLSAELKYTDHPEYLLAQELLSQSKQSNEAGYYDDSTVLANEAANHLGKLKAWISVLPYRQLTVTFEQTANTEITLARPSSEAREGYPTNSAAPWYETLSNAVMNYDAGLKSFSNADKLLVDTEFSNELTVAISYFTNASTKAKEARTIVKSWQDQQNNFSHMNQLLTDAITLFTNTVELTYIKTGDKDYLTVASQIDTGKQALASSNFSLTEESALNAIRYLNDLRLSKLATLKYQEADKRLTPFTKTKIAETNELQQAQSDLTNAKELLGRLKYEESITYSEKVLAWVEKIQKTPVMAMGNGKDLPMYYKVRDWSTSRDCFWNIAKYSFIYGDPLKWRALYEANKKTLQNPENPDLIQPGMRFTIPSIVGERRQGEAIPEDHSAPVLIIPR